LSLIIWTDHKASSGFLVYYWLVPADIFLRIFLRLSNVFVIQSGGRLGGKNLIEYLIESFEIEKKN
jgi:hypothetical protein